jgi:putative salt-induced outer membrane protein YdiY
MNNKLTLTALCFLPLMAFNSYAEEEKSAYTSSAELGFLFKTGNSKSRDIKAAFNLKYEKDQWRNALNINALAKKSEVENKNGDDELTTTDNKWDVIAQSNYSLNEDGKNYIYASVAYEQDKFSGFVNQSSLSGGWGRHFWETETSSFFADVGPGVKYDTLREIPATDTTPLIPESSETAAIIQAQALYTAQINDYVQFKQYFVAKQAVESEKNSSYRAESSITTKLIESLQFKFSFRVDYDTEVEPEYENTNTETSVTLVYSF